MAGRVTLAGPDSSFLDMQGSAANSAKYNAFSIGVTQSSMESVGFGETDAEVRGGVRRATITASGVTTAGTAHDHFGIAGMVSAPSAATGAMRCSFAAGCYLEMGAVMTGIGATVQLEAFSQSTYSFVKSGAITETWVSS